MQLLAVIARDASISTCKHNSANRNGAGREDDEANCVGDNPIERLGLNEQQMSSQRGETYLEQEWKHGLKS